MYITKYRAGDNYLYWFIGFVFRAIDNYPQDFRVLYNK